jgi:hypothetical protein
MTGRRGRYARIGVAVAIAVVALTACGSSGSGSGSTRRTPPRTSRTAVTTTLPATTLPPTTVAPTTTTTIAAFGSGGTPEEAIAAYVRTLPRAPAYAGDCAATDLARDVGKYCSALLSPATDSRTYGIGPTFSEGSERLTVVRIGTTWYVTAHAPLPAPGG